MELNKSEKLMDGEAARRRNPEVGVLHCQACKAPVGIYTQVDTKILDAALADEENMAQENWSECSMEDSDDCENNNNEPQHELRRSMAHLGRHLVEMLQ